MTIASPSVLPGIDSRSNAIIVIYDGFCSFCHSQMRLLHTLDLNGSLVFLSLHDSRSDQLLPGYSFDDKMRAMVVVEPGGRLHPGAHAIRYLSRNLPLLWLLAPLLHIPGSLPLWQALYDRVAQIRYRFGRRTCDGGTCELHGYTKRNQE